MEVLDLVADLTIAVDTREQDAHHQLEGCEVSKGVVVRYKPASLYVFDYCVYGDWTETNGKMVVPNFCIERKAIGDFIGSWFNSDNARREREKIKKARKLWGERLPIIYCLDGDHKDIGLYNYSRFPSGKVTPKAVHAKISDLRFANVQVLLCRSRVVAEYEIISLLKRRWRKVRFEKATKGGRNGGE